MRNAKTAASRAMLVPAAVQMPIVKPEHLRREPGGDMHSVGDVTDGDCLLGFARVEPGPHGPGNLAVEPTRRWRAVRA